MQRFEARKQLAKEVRLRVCGPIAGRGKSQARGQKRSSAPQFRVFSPVLTAETSAVAGQLRFT
jgi:hypothetical protein